METTFLYAIHGGNHTKIGVTGDIKRRMAGLQNASPVALRVVGLWKFDSRAAAFQAERDAHSYLGRFRQRGEWFEVEPRALVAAISTRMKLGEVQSLSLRKRVTDNSYTNGRHSARTPRRNAQRERLERKLRNIGLTKAEAQTLLSVSSGADRGRVFRVCDDGLYRIIL